ncbi:MAG TPA: 3-isopropylmalate dehydratase small subunit [Candidatus Nitrosocosmicus sp.]|nr:3-isopropylmalate dehydratase small subunit [Candidatus Nitrosocosmicus sp.]
MYGRVHKYNRANIDTDVIIPGQYLKIHDHDELAKHAMEGIDPDFKRKISEGDFLLVGQNFGCGSSREHAPIALSKSGIRAILSPSFARIFYRNAIDGGYLLPIEVDDNVLEQIDDEDKLEIDLENNVIRDVTKNDTIYKIKPFSKIISEIVKSGGLFNYKI